MKGTHGHCAACLLERRNLLPCAPQKATTASFAIVQLDQAAELPIICNQPIPYLNEPLFHVLVSPPSDRYNSPLYNPPV